MELIVQLCFIVMHPEINMTSQSLVARSRKHSAGPSHYNSLPKKKTNSGCDSLCNINCFNRGQIKRRDRIRWTIFLYSPYWFKSINCSLPSCGINIKFRPWPNPAIVYAVVRQQRPLFLRGRFAFTEHLCLQIFYARARRSSKRR